MKARTNESGFSPVMIALIIVVIALLGVSGWLVYDRQKKDSKSINTSAGIDSFDKCVAAGNPVMESYPEQCSANGKTYINERSGNPQPIKDDTANWLVYTAKDNPFTVRVADGWIVEDSYYGQGFNTFSNDHLAHKPGTKAIVNPFPGGRDGASGFFLNYATQNLEQIVTPGKKQTSLKTKDGLEVEKYYWVISGYAEEGLGAGNGDTEYTYVIRNNAKEVITASYTYQPGDTDHHEIIEKVLTTVHFN